MGVDFDWAIEDQPVALRPARRPPRRRRRWLVAGLLALIALLALAVPAGWNAWSRLNGQLLQREREAVLQLARAEEQLQAAGDREALLALQDPDYYRWREWQAAAPAVGLSDPSRAVIARLTYWGQTAANQYISVGSRFGEPVLAGETATLVVTDTWLAFASPAGGLDGPLITLEQTRHYRRAGDGWLRTGPPGEAITLFGQLSLADLELLYPLPDDAVARRLLPRLSALAGQACTDLGCPLRPRLVLTGILPDVLRRSETTRDALVVYAPAPLLIGAPLDQAAEEALVRFYAARLIDAIARNSPGAGDERLPAWLHWELARLGLEAPLGEDARRAAARAALALRVDILRDPFYANAGIWLGLDIAAERRGVNLLAERIGSGTSPRVTPSLALFVEEQRLAWQLQLEQVAALAPVRDSSAELAMICRGDLRLWRASTDAVLSLGYASDALLWSPRGRYLTARQRGLTLQAVGFDFASGSTWPSLPPIRAWAPDEQNNLVSTGGWVYRQPFGPGGRQVRLSPVPMIAFPSSWSPGGGAIALLRYDRGSTPGIYLLAPEGGEPERIATADQFAWSADGRYLALAESGAIGAPIEVYVPASGERRRLVGPLEGSGYRLAWSPVAPLLAVGRYTSDPEIITGTVELFDLAGGLRGSWSGRNLPIEISWSPDGWRLAWARIPPGPSGGRAEIVLAEIDRAREQVIATIGYDPSAVQPFAPGIGLGWSPDGRWLAFHDGADVVVWSAATGEIERRLAGCRAPAWRP
jgi:hypothetical protein